MNRKYKVSFFVLLGLGVIAAAIWYVHHAHMAVLTPQGEVGQKEKNLIVLALSLSLIVVIPVFTLLGSIAWRYRAGNKKAKYTPDWDRNSALETVWWLVPTALIIVLSIVTWKSSHELDPYKSLVSNTPAINVEVVAMDWKWLFIYPDQHIATVNMLEFPVNTPVNFHLTSDAPMNSFWIPQLGGQIYAMPGMSTQLNLMADKIGSYDGVSANISGAGFAGMKFTAKATTASDFNQWVTSAQRSSKALTANSYAMLSAHTYNNPVAYYTMPNDLYDTIVMKYMVPPQPPASTPKSNNSQMPAMTGMQGMDMQGMKM